eukprot:TRINITY_DN55171_c0_g1_i1.p1 TRINITY_DN55171_c0_g1~~TRINITY_DN55171_c0_g1_i1.p1  ORF type:complete len:242 (+),score=40.28 TRINITY_DN55171_c0_g1_i1:158-883(+)
MANFASLSDLKKKDEVDKKATTSYTGGEKSGLAVENPTNDEERWKRMEEKAVAQSNSGPLPPNHTQITIFRNGFLVGDGPFRPLSDPLNKKFVDEISDGRCPRELEKGKNQQVHVAVIDKRSEDYQEPPPPAYVRFSGEGQSLGGCSSLLAATVDADQGSVVLDDSKPKTKIQIRFHNGERKAQEFNEDHTVGDIRAYCCQCVGGRAMTIMGGFPPTPLTDDSATLKASGLCGAAVTARPA